MTGWWVFFDFLKVVDILVAVALKTNKGGLSIKSVDLIFLILM